MEYIISTIIAITISLFMLFIGIKMLSTNRHLSEKINKISVDSPRALGIIFTYLGIIGLIFSYHIFFANPTQNAPSENITKIFEILSFSIGCVGGSAIMTIIGVYNLIKKTIFGIKKLPETKSIIEKNYKEIGFLSIITGIFIPWGTVINAFFSPSNNFLKIIPIIGIVSLLILCFKISKIERKAENSRIKKTKSCKK